MPELSSADVSSDPRYQPAYSYREASRALNIPSSTLRYWTKGQRYEKKSGEGFAEPIISMADPAESALSFINLIEAHTLRALRTSHRVSMGAVREALGVAEQEYKIDRLLIHSQLRTTAGDLFLERYGEIVELTNSQQIVLKEMFQGYLNRVDYDDSDLPVSFYPLTRGPKVTDSPKIIVLNPSISFGRPVIKKQGISTRAIESRVDAGETIPHVAKDYGISEEAVREALRYEVAAQQLPTFFTDRDLGPTPTSDVVRVLRNGGLSIECHAEHFEATAPDHEWLEYCGERGWIPLTKDKRIGYSELAKNVIMNSEVQLIVLIGSYSHSKLARNVVHSVKTIERFLEQHEDPFITRLYTPSEEDFEAKKSGTMKMWPSHSDWAE